jgi:hypothetical protein
MARRVLILLTMRQSPTWDYADPAGTRGDTFQVPWYYPRIRSDEKRLSRYRTQRTGIAYREHTTRRDPLLSSRSQEEER